MIAAVTLTCNKCCLPCRFCTCDGGTGSGWPAVTTRLERPPPTRPGGLIHILLVIALAVVIIRLLQGRGILG
ncbi:MAG: lmo0937 family membrane protein [Bryobacteraceae bacterium]